MKEKIGSLWILLTLLAAASPAQIWRGAEAVAVQVNDGKGRSVANARVVFTFQGVPGEAGPDIVATDSNGRAVLADLAPGPWQVEIRHPEYLSYIAMLDVRRGKKPLVSASFLEAGGRSLSPIKIKFSKGDRQQPSPVLEARRPVEPPAAAPPTPEVRTDPAPQIAEAPKVATAPTPPVAEPRVAAPEPAPEIESAPVTSPPPSTEPEVEIAVPAEEPAPPPQPTAIEAVPEPEPDLIEPATEPEPVAMAPVVEESRTVAIEAVAEPEIVVEDVAQDLPEADVNLAETSPAAEPRPSIEPEPEVAEPTPEAVPVPAPSPVTPSPQPEPPVQATPPPDVITETVTAEPSIAQPTSLDEPPTVDTPADPVQQEERLMPPPGAPPGKTTALPPPPNPGVIVTSHSDGTCSDCQSAEWTLTVSIPVPARAQAASGSCGPEVLAAAKKAMQGLSTSIQLELDGFLGPVANASSQEAIRRVEPDLAANFDDNLAPFLGGASPCQIVGLVLPKAVRFSRVQLAAGDDQATGNCAPGQACSIGDAAWLGSVLAEKGSSATVIYGLFENRSTERGRRAILTAYYRPPNANWKPRIPALD